MIDALDNDYSAFFVEVLRINGVDVEYVSVADIDDNGTVSMASSLHYDYPFRDIFPTKSQNEEFSD